MSYISNTESDVRKMLGVIGADSIDDLFADIPPEARLHEPLSLPDALSEIETDTLLKKIANSNNALLPFAGGGSYCHYIPAAVDQLSSRSEFYTAYTPYQPEVSQGTLNAIYEYQTMICRLTGMDVANASMYDGATACVESVLMSVRMSGKNRIIVSDTVHPNYREVLRTYGWAAGLEIEETESSDGKTGVSDITQRINDNVGTVVIQSPNFFGIIEDIKKIAGCTKEHSVHLVVVVTEAMSLGLLKSPGECGADIVCGEGQSFGNYQGFGGPGLGILAAKETFLRRMPGRLVGKTVDAEDNTAFCLTIQTREQHIRRENATSNICSNEGLCALRAAIYLSLKGKNLRGIAELNHRLTCYMKNKLVENGIDPVFSHPFFNEILINCADADRIIGSMRAEGYLFGIDISRWYPKYKDCVLLCATECVTTEEIDQMISTFIRVRGS